MTTQRKVSKNGVAVAVLAVLMLVILGKVYTLKTSTQDLGALALNSTATCSATPSLTVLSPNGAEQYKPGQQILVSWSSCAIARDADIAIDVLQIDPTTRKVTTFPVIGNTLNDGSQPIVLPSTVSWPQIKYGTNFKIKVRYVTPAGVRVAEDQSDQQFRIADLKVVMGTPSYNRTTNANGQVTSVTYTIPLTVTPTGSDLYLRQAATLGETVVTSSAFAFVFQNSINPTVSDRISSGSWTVSSSDAPEVTSTTPILSGFRVDDGSTKHFTLTVTLTSPSMANSSYRIALKQFQAFTTLNMFTQDSIKTLLIPAESYRTDYQFINN
jgi:hypothetical protein